MIINIMTFEGLGDNQADLTASIAPDVEAFDPAAFLATHGLEDMADQMFEAHGGTFSVTEALVQCQPFADMVRGLAKALKDSPGCTEILKTTIASLGNRAANPPEGSSAKKKLLMPLLTS
ncbi:MAG TPA: hypothetical protein VLG37_05505 [Candidatus Saccharimonadales bacterium]|nr:hypothetical protein [Candidatus Saccharimonadales bacterium]